MKFKKRGGISTVIATIIGVVLLVSIFYQFFFMHLDLERYNMINQYSRDILLICETMDSIDKNYLLNAKENLSDRIVKKDTEYIKMYLSIEGDEYDVDTMPQSVKADFGDTIELLVEYYYQPQRISFGDGITPKRADENMEVMGVRLTTVSKNRGTSDG